MKRNLLCFRLALWCVLIAASIGGVPQAEGQTSSADIVCFLEQSTVGPTNELIAHVEEIGFDAFLNEQASASMTDYPDLPFWPQTRPTSCTGECQRDNYTM